MTDIFKQYEKAKAAYPDGILLFRMGDFYEAFDDDAPVVAAVLKLSLTQRGEQVMVGFPYHCLDRSVKQLVAAGHRAVVVEPV